MPFNIIPTTELEAVNECLENIGQPPVATISGDLGVDTELALNFVRRNNRQLQSMGWYWNTEVNYELTPDGNGDVLLPSNTLAVDTVGTSATRNVVQRGQRLYDKDNFTYNFGTELVYVNLIVGLTFEELPETARRYIAMRSARSSTTSSMNAGPKRTTSTTRSSATRPTWKRGTFSGRRMPG